MAGSIDGSELKKIEITGNSFDGWTLRLNSPLYCSVRPLRENGEPVRDKELAQVMAEEILDRDYPRWRESKI